MSKIALVFILMGMVPSIQGEEDLPQLNSNVIYKYKKKEVIDFGKLTIKGNILTPGDLSIKFNTRQKFKRTLMRKLNFDKEMADDLDQIK